MAIDRQFRINERITAREVRVIDDEGNQLGIMPSRKALMIAREKGLDLVMVSPTSNPPVCRILDFGKFKYETEKQERESRKKHKQAELKAIRIRPNIDDHDIAVKVRRAIEFFQDGDKVKFTLIFRSREITRPERGHQVLEKIVKLTEEYGAVEKPAVAEGRTLIMIMAPKKGATKPAEKAASTGGKENDAEAENEQVGGQAV